MIYIQHGQHGERGSFAVVNPALEVDDETGACRQVAVKRIRTRSEFPRGRKYDLLHTLATTLFARERRIWCTLRPHPGIVPALRATRIDGEPVLLLEYLYGATLDEMLEAPNGPMHPVDLLELCDQLASALRHLHESCRVAHGDVSPQNIFYDGTGLIQLSDFSLATHAGEALAGSPDLPLTLSAPEQKHALDVTPAVDTWKAGICILLAVRGESLSSAVRGNLDLGGHKSWKKDIASSLERSKHAIDDAVPIQSLKDFLLRALAPDPAARFADGGELAAAVQQLMSVNPRWAELLAERRQAWGRLRHWSRTSPRSHSEALDQLTAFRTRLHSRDYVSEAHRLLPESDHLIAHAAWLSSKGRSDRAALLRMARSQAQSSFEIFDGDPRPLEIMVQAGKALRQNDRDDSVELQQARDLIRLFSKFKTFVRAHQVRELQPDLERMTGQGNHQAEGLLHEVRVALAEFDQRLLQHYKNLEDRLIDVSDGSRRNARRLPV